MASVHQIRPSKSDISKPPKDPRGIQYKKDRKFSGYENQPGLKGNDLPSQKKKAESKEAPKSAPKEATKPEASKKQTQPDKPLTHKNSPKLDLNFWDRMAPQKGQGGHTSVNREQLGSLLSEGKYGFISAGKNPNDPADRKLTDQQIELRYDEMRKDLKEQGVKFIEGVGSYGDREKTFMLINPDRKALLELGAKYKQDSVIYADSGHQEMAYTTGDKAGKSVFGQGWEETPEATDMFSEFTTTDGKQMKFSLNFDFGKEHDSAEKQWSELKGEPAQANDKSDAAQATSFDSDVDLTTSEKSPQFSEKPPKFDPRTGAGIPAFTNWLINQMESVRGKK